MAIVQDQFDRRNAAGNNYPLAFGRRKKGFLLKKRGKSQTKLLRFRSNFASPSRRFRSTPALNATKPEVGGPLVRACMLPIRQKYARLLHGQDPQFLLRYQAGVPACNHHCGYPHRGFHLPITGALRNTAYALLWKGSLILAFGACERQVRTHMTQAPFCACSPYDQGCFWPALFLEKKSCTVAVRLAVPTQPWLGLDF